MDGFRVWRRANLAICGGANKRMCRAYACAAAASLTLSGPGPKWPELAKSRHNIGLIVPAAGP